MLARFVMAGLGLALIAYSRSVWRSKRMPLMVGKADALYWGERSRSRRIWNTIGLGVFGALMVIGAIIP